MYAIDFEYAGERLSDYGMMICSFNGGGGLETVSSGADITFNQVKPSMSNRFNLYSSTYDSAYTTTFQICKNPCMKINNKMSISTTEISALQRWLCRKNQYNRFKIDQEGYENIYWNATFSAKQIELGGNIVGMELTLYTDAPFAYMDELIMDYTCSSDKSFDIYDVSDEEGYIYPDMTITLLEDGQGNIEDNGEVNAFILKNTMDEYSPLKINNCLKGEVITIKGKSQILLSSNHEKLMNDFNFYFPRIINSYTNNKNTFSSNTKCNITLSYSPIIKVGL